MNKYLSMARLIFGPDIPPSIVDYYVHMVARSLEEAASAARLAGERRGYEKGWDECAEMASEYTPDWREAPDRTEELKAINPRRKAALEIR
jgi:hypothetical protein